jgi:hypothetical protein
MYLIVVPVLDDVVVRDASLDFSHDGPRAAPAAFTSMSQAQCKLTKCYAFTFSFLSVRSFSLCL